MKYVQFPNVLILIGYMQHWSILGENNVVTWETALQKFVPESYTLLLFFIITCRPISRL